MKVKKFLRNFFWGLFFIAGAASIIFHQLGYFNEIISFPALVLIVVLSPIMIMSLFHLNFFGVFAPAAALAIFFREPLGLEAVSPWAIAFAALFLSIGFSIIFHRNKFNFGHYHNGSNGQSGHFDSIENLNDDVISFSESFGASTKYIHSENLKKASFKCTFGAMQVYFDNSKIDPEGAEIYIEASFCGMELYIPKNWNIVNNIHASLGGISEKNHRGSSEGPRVRLIGNVSLGGIEIIYV